MPIDHPKSAVTRIAVAFALSIVATVGLSAPAVASQGSVPSEVSRYAADPDGLLAQLDDLFGVTASGVGIDFDETTEVGQLNRAWVFTEAWMAGAQSGSPVELANLWTAPILIAEQPVGLATIWINPATDAPDLADFDRSASVATTMLDVPADVSLVRDDLRGAWFTLLGAELTPLVVGDSGVDAPTSVSTYQRTIVEITDDAARPPGPNLNGLVGAGLVAGAAVIVIIVVLLLPALRRRAGDDNVAKGTLDETGAITLPTLPAEPKAPSTVAPVVESFAPTPEPAIEPVAKPKTTTAKTTPARPTTTKPATPKPKTATVGSTTAKKPTTAAKKPATAAKKPATAAKKPASTVKPKTPTTTRKPPSTRPATTPEEPTP